MKSFNKILIVKVFVIKTQDVTREINDQSRYSWRKIGTAHISSNGICCTTFARNATASVSGINYFFSG